MARAKTFTCPNCKTKSEKIGISSICTQTLHLGTDSYTDTDVGDTLQGFCLECGMIISNKKLKALTGLVVTGKDQP